MSAANRSARAAYAITCTVSIPEISSKNHPQLVYINCVWRCISISLRISVRSSAESVRTAWVAKKLLDSLPGIILSSGQDDRDISIAGSPHIMEHAARGALTERRHCISQPIKRATQRRAPPLVPPLAPTIAAAVRAPALNAVGAAPRRILHNLRLPFGRKNWPEIGRSWSAWPAFLSSIYRKA